MDFLITGTCAAMSFLCNGELPEKNIYNNDQLQRKGPRNALRNNGFYMENHNPAKALC